MPVGAKSPCRYQGCRQLVNSGYCDQHKESSNKKQFDKLRGSSNARGYTYKWQKARLAYLFLHPLCVECSDLGLVVAATVVDHVMPHKGDQVLFWDQSNWQSLCATCHNRKTATKDSGFAGGEGRVKSLAH